MMDWIMLIGGLAGLVVAAEFFVRGASGLARIFGLSSLIIGLTVVAFGTSAPEMGVSVSAGLAGKSSIAVANVAGSNLFNVLAILGLSALIAPLAVQSQLVRVDVPVMIGASVLLLLFAWDGALQNHEGVMLFLLILIYTGFLIWLGLREGAVEARGDEGDQEGRGPGHVLLLFVYIVGGLTGLVFGSDWTVTGASAIARDLGVSDRLIGLTIVAVGTSLPELATSLVATYRGERDIAVGNVIGSNIFNILAILGLAATVAPEGLEVNQALRTIDLPAVLVVALLCLPVFLTGRVISRKEGVFFLALYAGYVTWLILD